MIAILHTSAIHIDRFENLVKSIDDDANTKHFVNENLLEIALKSGKTDSNEFKNQISDIKKIDPSIIICTCSTYGKESDLHQNVYRIDRPIVEYIVSKFRKIGLAYTANSTKEVSSELLLETAKSQNKEIEIINCDCSSHWTHFEKGNLGKYESGIANSIKDIENLVDVIFLAQASMEGVKSILKKLNKEIVSSPEYGVTQLMKINRVQQGI
jgi:hypothetical protein